jgi:hypothetical protein
MNKIKGADWAPFSLFDFSRWVLFDWCFIRANFEGQIIVPMKSLSIKKQVDNYLPLLSDKQQVLVLEMIKTMLNVDADEKRVTLKQYNTELNEAVARVKKGKSVDHKKALIELSKW